MKKLIALFIITLLPMGAFAQDVKIAFVNTQEIFMAMPEVGDMEKKIADLSESYKKELTQMQEEFSKKYSDYVAQQDSLTENIKLRRMQEIEDMRGRIENLMQTAEEDVRKKQQELLSPIREKMTKAIKTVGDEKGYTYIVDPQVLLYTGNSAIDATSFVKTKLGLK